MRYVLTILALLAALSTSSPAHAAAPCGGGTIDPGDPLQTLGGYCSCLATTKEGRTPPFDRACVVPGTNSGDGVEICWYETVTTTYTQPFVCKFLPGVPNCPSDSVWQSALPACGPCREPASEEMTFSEWISSLFD